MVNISRLSNRTLSSILLSVIEPYIRGQVELNNWKHMLLLLGVCRQWSRILLPLVYQYAIIQCSRITRESINSDQPQLLNNIGNYVWKSNISIIRKRKVARRVRRMNITIKHNIDDIILLCNMLVSLLDLGNTDWSSVVILYMSFMYSRPENVIKVSAEDKNRIANIANTIRQNIPNLNTLNFGSTLDNNPAKSFVEALTSTYAGQLMDFRCLSPIYVTAQQFSMSLAYLNVALDDNSTKLLPLVYSKALKHLELHQVPLRFTWQYFSTSYGNKTILFDNLETISLHYQNSEAVIAKIIDQDKIQASSYYIIHMPKLKHMVLNNAPPFGDILFSDYEMPCLEYVSINGGLRMAARFGELAFYASKRMRIDIKEIDKHNNEYLYISTNDLFSKNRRAPYTELLFNHNGFDIDFGRARWHYLDKLDIFGEIDFNHLLELIIKLPLLDSLNITSLVFSNYEIGMHNQTTQQASSKGVDMLHTNITNLSISCDTDVYSTDLVLSKVMYFVIRMQSLKNLELESEIELPARDLIDRYKDYFPHLANIIVQEGLVFIK